MAGLLDIFGTGGTDTLGLLGMSPEAIKRSRDDAQAQALYSLAGSLLSGGPTGLSIVRGLQQGSQAYRNAMQGQLQEQMQSVQLQDALRRRQQEQAALARQEAANRLLPNLITPEVAAVPAQFYGQQTQMPVMDDEGNLMPGATAPVAGRAGGMNRDVFNALSTSPEGQKALLNFANLQKAMRPETFSLPENAVQFERDPFTGETRQVAVGAQKRQPIQFQDLGNVVIGIQDGKEVLRLPKGRAPEGPVSLQTVETENGVQLLNPRTGALSPLMQNGKPVMGKGSGALTEGQGNAVTYGLRMVQADQILKPLEDAGLKDTGKIRAGVTGTLSAFPLIGESLGRGSDNVFNVLPSILGGLSPEQQKVIQARTNFITALLRKESGAAIGANEYTTAEKNYFPAPGDPPDVVRQKQAAREAAIKGMKISAGPGGKFIDQGQVPAPPAAGDLAAQAAAELKRREKEGR